MLEATNRAHLFAWSFPVLRLATAFLGCLPTIGAGGEAAKTIAESAALVTKLGNSDMKFYCSRAAQGEFLAWSDLLYNMRKGISPDSALLSQDNMHTQIGKHLRYFLREADSSGAVVYGEQALALIMERLSGECALGKPNSGIMDELTNLHSFRFLMSPDVWAQLQALTAAAVPEVEGHKPSVKKRVHKEKQEKKKKNKKAPPYGWGGVSSGGRAAWLEFPRGEAVRSAS